MGRRFGDAADPLLVSVRSGAAISMPGMMDTILNLGLNRDGVHGLEAAGADPRWVRDCYRRLLQMYGDVVLEVGKERFEAHLTAARQKQGAKTDAELTAESLDGVIAAYEALLESEGKPFPQDPRDQLWGAIGAVFGSWDNRRAREYRRLHGISESLGTAVNVQAMVFGNRGDDCATGVGFTRNPATGESRFFGEYLVNAQGEDVVAGIRTPQPIEGSGPGTGMASDFPQAHGQLHEVAQRLERHFRDMQDLEFTVEAGKLYLLQTRGGKRTGPAAVRIAVEMAEAGLLTPDEAVQRVEPEQLEQLLAPGFDLAEKRRAIADGRLLAKGLPAGPGAACGRIALTAERAAEMAAAGPVLLVREETSPEDIVGMHASKGILTSRGGMTSHAAVVARGLGKPCIVGAEALHVDSRFGVAASGGAELPRRRRAVDRRHHRRGDRRRLEPAPVADRARADPRRGRRRSRPRRRLRQAARLGRRGAPAARARQRRHSRGRAGGARLRRARDRPLPHRAHVLRRGPHRLGAADDPRRERGGAEGGARRRCCRCSRPTSRASSRR